MPGLANDLVVHNLHVVPGAKTVKQSPRQFRHEIEEQIKQEKKKLLKAGFTKQQRRNLGAKPRAEGRKRKQ